MTANPRWRLQRLAGTVAELHSRDIPALVERTVTVLEPVDGAVVLGTTQGEAFVDRARAASLGLEVVRRRSGGGAVLVQADDLVWLDVDLPRDDVLWDDDVGRSFGWLGAVWQSALDRLGIPARVHEGPLVVTSASRMVCFAGIGPGELLTPGDGGEGKIVGMAQRRTRAGARFQCAFLRAWRPDALLASLVGADAPGIADLVRRAGVARPVPPGAVVEAVMTALGEHPS